MKLISMTDFVLEQNEKINENFKKNILMTQGETLDELNNFIDIITNYANFLKKPLKLGYFIPCDKNDVPLKEAKELNFKNDDDLEDYCFKYSISKQRVLFEYQWEFQSWDSSDMENSRIEDLLSDELTYILTETAIKEIGIL